MRETPKGYSNRIRAKLRTVFEPVNVARLSGREASPFQFRRPSVTNSAMVSGRNDVPLHSRLIRGVRLLLVTFPTRKMNQMKAGLDECASCRQTSKAHRMAVKIGM
jgi:hypothetical protein